MTGFIVPSNLKYAPYVQYYVDAYKKNGAEFEIISWDRKGIGEEVDFAYHKAVEDHDRFGVLLGYIGFSSFVKRIVKKRKYDKLVVFTVAAAVAISGILKKYKGKYILDIRDASPLVTKAEKKFKAAVSGAAEVVSSSPNFAEWIGRDAHICHNVDISVLEGARDIPVSKLGGGSCRIVFAGLLIEQAINARLVESVANDSRYSLSFYGTPNAGRDEIEKYVVDNGVNNVSFFGTYQKAQITSIYRENADFVNVIRKKSRVNKDALPNKLYDAIGAGVPIIVFRHNEAIAKYAEEYNLGLILEEGDENNFAEAIQVAVDKFDRDAFESGRMRFIDHVISEQNKYLDIVTKFIGMS